VLRDVRFHIEAGQKVALLGPSGAGKSTVAALVHQFYPVSSGEIFINRQPADTYDLRKLRGTIGVVPQETMLFGGTIRKADKILVIDQGRVAEEGSHEELLQFTDGLYANLVRLQFELH
jgi:ABC-type multidrug transport system fused ATPase/permease subunit